MEYELTSIKFRNEKDETRIELRYDDGVRSIVRDPCDSRFCRLVLENAGNAFERAQARRSLKRFSRFLLDHKVQVSAGLDCWNLFCSGCDCGLKSSRGVLFIPPEDVETYGSIANTPLEQGYRKVHLTTQISQNGAITNLIKLRKEGTYLVAGELDVTIPQSSVSFRRSRRYRCDCEQCTDGGFRNDLEEAIVNPLEILSQRYQSTQVATEGTWLSCYQALVYKDEEGTYRIKGYLTPITYKYVCDQCKLMGTVTKCRDGCLERRQGKDGPDLDIVEPGNAAVVGKVLEFCPVKFRELQKSLKQVTGRLNSLGVKQGGEVLSEIARLVRTTRMEVAFVLNNDTSLVQPIVSGANCFLRRDIRGRWDSCETLSGSELYRQIFFVDEAGVWIMIGSGDKYGVSSTNASRHHLVLGGEQSMVYGAHLDNQQFGGVAE